MSLPLTVYGYEDSSGNSIRYASANEIRDNIQKGKSLNYDNYYITGYDLSNLEIEGDAHFNNTFFLDGVDFNSTVFKGNAYFKGATFSRYATFIDTTFSRIADFVGATFSKNTNFQRATFSGEALFWGDTWFGGEAYFGGANFCNFTDFVGATFNESAVFGAATFRGNAIFGANFRKDADFVIAKFNGYADFFKAKFSGNSDFKYAQFDKEATFDDAQFNGTVSFYSSRFKDDTLFENTTFGGVLDITRTKYEKLFIRWPSIKNGLVYDENAYQQLIENFKNLGYSSDVDNSYYQFRKEQFSHRKMTDDIQVYIFDLVAWYTYGFGKRPIFPLVWSAFFVLLFGGIWIAFGSKKSGNSERIRLDHIGNALCFSLTVFLSGTGKFFVNTPATPEIHGRSRLMINSIFNLERLLGAFLSIMFILAITGMVLKSV